MGEGSIQALKQKISRLSGKWALCALKSYYEDQSMISLIHECIGNITNNFSKPFANNANLDMLRTSFNGEKSNNTTELAEERSTPKRKAHPTDSEDKLIGYVPDSPLLNDDIKAAEMVLDMSTNKMYFLRHNSTSLYEITVNYLESSEVVIVCGASFFEMNCMFTSDNAIEYDTLIKDNLQCGLILKHNDNKKLCYALAYNWLELTKTTSGALKFVFPRHPEFEYED